VGGLWHRESGWVGHGIGRVGRVWVGHGTLRVVRIWHTVGTLQVAASWNTTYSLCNKVYVSTGKRRITTFRSTTGRINMVVQLIFV
jgi:hypothetical protein